MKALLSSGCGRQLAAPCPARPLVRRGGLRTLPARQCPPPPATLVRAAAGSSLLSSLEARLDSFITQLSGGEAQGAATRTKQFLLGLLFMLQRLLRWVQLAAVALQLQLGIHQRAQPQLAFAGPAGSGDSSSPLSTSAVPPATSSIATAAPPAPQQPAAAVMDFLSAATLGAVEQLRHTLTDASQGIESKMSVIERTASSVQCTLFQAAQAHSEAVRSNPQGGMWKQPCVESVISEEERLRQAVFAQVYAELLQKDNSQLSFNAAGQP